MLSGKEIEVCLWQKYMLSKKGRIINHIKDCSRDKIINVGGKNKKFF